MGGQEQKSLKKIVTGDYSDQGCYGGVNASGAVNATKNKADKKKRIQDLLREAKNLTSPNQELPS